MNRGPRVGPQKLRRTQVMNLSTATVRLKEATDFVSQLGSKFDDVCQFF